MSWRFKPEDDYCAECGTLVTTTEAHSIINTGTAHAPVWKRIHFACDEKAKSRLLPRCPSCNHLLRDDVCVNPKCSVTTVDRDNAPHSL